MYQIYLTSKPVSFSKTKPLLQVDANTGHKQAEESFLKKYVGNARSNKQKSASTPQNNNFSLHKKGLKIDSLNICYLLPKLDEIRLSLNESNVIHILGLCETFLNDDILNNKLQI